MKKNINFILFYSGFLNIIIKIIIFRLFKRKTGFKKERKNDCKKENLIKLILMVDYQQWQAYV